MVFLKTLSKEDLLEEIESIIEIETTGKAVMLEEIFALRSLTAC